ncbi:urease [Kordiimonas sediminis]|uniref:Urease n=1 Tax=Kordiimonas sediminis TaxID=1735581 RepID=A0A919ANF7_9PROT|nr:DUF1272 domain-containing protein [Kordiimonas sediminis]GHF16411.1 urease [Kordiimonas sediminis]
MLDMRPNCEHCDTDLPADSTQTMICSYECTFCKDCAETIFENVCPNCGGGFSPRPVRPQTSWRPGVSLHHQPAQKDRHHKPKDLAEFAEFSAPIKKVAPQNR